MLTRSFDSAGADFEAGVAELYDYSHLGADPLKDLVVGLGLETIPMTSSRTVILNDKVVTDPASLRRHFGKEAEADVSKFYRSCEKLYSPNDYYLEDWQFDKKHAWSDRLFSDVLDNIKDPTARKYLAVSTRSDIATEPYLTSALNGLKNVLMNDQRYIRLYSIKGGIERLIDRLASEVLAEVRLNSPVVRIGRTPRGYRITSRREHRVVSEEFDVVMLALPHYWLGQIDWDDIALRQHMQRHLANYDFPAHYLRISCLFEKPFWRRQMIGSYFMLDAFGGCCVYDESARYPHGPYGVLGWLLAGNAALALSNLEDWQLISLALGSLPDSMAEHRQLFLEGKVHRWVGAVNAHPGGKRLLDMRHRHRPDAVGNPYLLVIGDYLLDSTINAVVDSAEYAAGALLSNIYREKHAVRVTNGNNHKTSFDNYFDEYAGGEEIQPVLQELFLRTVDVRPDQGRVEATPAV